MMQQGKLVGAYANAVQDAANNANGAANGFMGIGMMNMTSGGMMGGAVQGPWQNATPVQPVMNNQPETSQQPVVAPVSTNANEWVCPNCNTTVTGKFCGECGTKKPEGKFCSNCGNKLTETAKFCGECGTKVE